MSNNKYKKSGIIVIVITSILAFSGWASLFYNWYTSAPKINGQVLGLLISPQLQDPAFTKTGIVVYLYLVNERKYPTHILDYELEFDLGQGYEKAMRLYSITHMVVPSIRIDQDNLTIPNFTEKIIYLKNQPVEYGVPLHGFAVFVTDRPYADVQNDKIKRIRVTCIDAFKNRHVITSYNGPFNSSLLRDIAGMVKVQ